MLSQYRTTPEMAAVWGQEDAIEQRDRRGSDYFIIGSPAWHAYNEGYDDGLQALRMLARPLDLAVSQEVARV